MALKTSLSPLLQGQPERDFKNHLLGGLPLARSLLPSQYGCVRAFRLSSLTKNKAQLCVLYFYFLEYNMRHLATGPPRPPSLRLGPMLFLLCTTAALTQPVGRAQPRPGRKRPQGQTPRHVRLCVSGADGDWHREEPGVPAGEGVPGSPEPGWGRPRQSSGQEPLVSLEGHTLWPRRPMVFALWGEHREVKPWAVI